VRSAILLALLLWQATPGAQPVAADPQYLRYQRTITVPAGAGQSCAVVDPQIFPHAAPSLKDLRLYQDGREVPYAITLSEPQQPDSDTALVRNLGLRGRNIVFDVEMPNRPYTEITLDLAGQDFLATATVSGTRDPNYSNQTRLGEFTLFDLTSQHLSRNTTLHLQEASLPYLHIELAVSPATGNRTFIATPEMVQGVTVPPSREAQSFYTTAATATTITRRGRQSVATFALPERIPVERVSFDLTPSYKANFSRDVRITDRPKGSSNSVSESLAGTILRVNLTQTGREIRQEQLSVPAILGSNMQSAATVEVAVENGDDTPLPITTIRLEMRQRKICFDAPSAQALTLFYGDSALTAPQYDYARLFSTSDAVHAAQLGSERLNPAYRNRPDSRPLTDRHPHLLWIVLLAVVCILAIVAIRSSKTVHH
jgi:hypothetical protein